MVAQDITQITKSHRLGDGFTGHRHIQDQGVEITAGIWMLAPLLDQELRQRAAVFGWHRGTPYSFLAFFVQVSNGSEVRGGQAVQNSPGAVEIMVHGKAVARDDSS